MHKCDELIDESWPAPVILKIFEVTPRLNHQIVEQVPVVLGDGEQLTPLFLSLEEGDPLVQKLALILLDKELPDANRRLYREVLLPWLHIISKGRLV